MDRVRVNPIYSCKINKEKKKKTEKKEKKELWKNKEKKREINESCTKKWKNGTEWNWKEIKNLKKGINKTRK